MDHFSDLVRGREAQIHEVRRIEWETKARVTADCLAAARKDAETAPVASPVTRIRTRPQVTA
jgi:hypothetical protein